MKKTITFFLCLSLFLIGQAQVSKTINVTTAGTLSTLLTTTEKTTLTDLIVTGNIDARDFRIMRDSMPDLSSIDLSTVSVLAYTGVGGTIGLSTNSYSYQANWVPEGAFCNSYFSSSKTNLTDLKLPLNVDTIGGYSFAQTYSLKSIYIPASVKCIVYKAFWKSACNIIVDSLNQSYKSIDGVLFTKDTSTLLYYPGSNVGGYTIPEQVLTIGTLAFSDCRNLSSINLSLNLKNINQSAFLNCIGLKVITFPESLNYIWDFAFSGCTGLTTISLPATTIVSGGAFQNCTNLTTATYPNLQSLVTNIFYGCTSLSAVSFFQATTTINAYSFKNCSGLTTMDIPTGITTIENNVFESCTGLTTIKIPSTISRIMYRAFYGCSKLSSIYMYANTPTDITVNNIEVFSGVNTTSCILYVPKGRTATYKNYWGIFKNIVEMTTAVPMLADSRVSIYPNPVTTTFQISGIEGTYTITLSDLNGKTLLKKQVTGSENISVANLPKGMYIAKVTTKEGTIERKIVKE